jgi:hypothetical protein
MERALRIEKLADALLADALEGDLPDDPANVARVVAATCPEATVEEVYLALQRNLVRLKGER